MTVAGVTYLPAVLLVTALALALFLGDLLRFPGWVLDLSPVTHTPALPADEVSGAPLLAMAGIAVVVAAVGLRGYRRRDIQSR